MIPWFACVHFSLQQIFSEQFLCAKHWAVPIPDLAELKSPERERMKPGVKQPSVRIAMMGKRAE